MIAQVLRQIASENLVSTYFHLGLATPGAGTWEEDAFLACLGDFEHPICNFAARLSLDPWSARRLNELASARPAFHVYALPSDSPDHVGELLTRADFRCVYYLSEMVAPSEAKDVEPLIEAQTFEHRIDVARFMSEQFFEKQPMKFKQRVSEATALATSLKLFQLEVKGQRVGSVMLCEQPEILGIYNLCISSTQRGKGLGKRIIEWCRSYAADRGVPVTLQCDPRLEAWYVDQGFASIGKVEVFALSQRPPRVIMDSVLVH